MESPKYCMLGMMNDNNDDQLKCIVATFHFTLILLSWINQRLIELSKIYLLFCFTSVTTMTLLIDDEYNFIIFWHYSRDLFMLHAQACYCHH